MKGIFYAWTKKQQKEERKTNFYDEKTIVLEKENMVMLNSTELS